MIAVDTNILIYAHRRDSLWHDPASSCIRELAQDRAAWAIAWPSIHEFLSIATNRRIYVPSSTLEEAIAQFEAWAESPRLQLIGEQEGYWDQLKSLLRNTKLSGAQVHDARIAAICLLHGVSELWTADRDFSFFPALRTRNPLVV